MSFAQNCRWLVRSRHRNRQHEFRTNLQGQRGIALVAVLWLLLLLAIVSGVMLRVIRAHRAVAATTAALVAAQLEDDGAINWTILSLLSPTAGERWKLDGSPRTIRLFDRDITIQVEAEAGKFDLNAAPASTIAGLFRRQGLGVTDADELARKVVTWRSPLGSMQADEDTNAYLDAHRMYRPRHAPFMSADELGMVIGMTPGLKDQVVSLVTVFSGSPSVDRGTASDGVLKALQEAGDAFAKGQLDARDRGAAAGVDRPVLQGEALTIRASIDASGISKERSAVVRLGGSFTMPYKIERWQ